MQTLHAGVPLFKTDGTTETLPSDIQLLPFQVYIYPSQAAEILWTEKAAYSLVYDVGERHDATRLASRM